MGRFLEEACLATPNASVQAKVIYSAYAQWCEDNGQRPTSNARFSTRLAERGYGKRLLDGRTLWLGIGLRATEASGGF